MFCKSDVHMSWDKNCLELIGRSNNYDNSHPENKMVYFPTSKNWMLTTKPNRIPLEEWFLQRYAISSLPITNRKAPTSNKRAASTKHIEASNTQGNTPNTINNYLICPQDKSKGKALAQVLDNCQIVEEYNKCFDSLENNDVEKLLGSPFQSRY